MMIANEREHTDQDHLAMHTLVHLFLLLVTYESSWPIEDELVTAMKSVKLNLNNA